MKKPGVVTVLLVMAVLATGCGRSKDHAKAKHKERRASATTTSTTLPTQLPTSDRPTTLP